MWLKKLSLNWPSPVYMLLLAVFPILYLYSHNIREMEFSQIVLPMTICTGGAILLWIILVLILRDGRKAGLSVAIFLIFFFAYGRVHDFLENLRISGNMHAYLFSIMIFIWGYCVYFISRVKRDFRTTTTILNIVFAVLIAINIVNISVYHVNKSEVIPEKYATINIADNRTSFASQSYPDIYFIILDEYSHPDTLKEYYNYDNSQFIKSLEDAGFYIADKSRTRSLWTPQAISQVLNMEYFTAGWYWDDEKHDYIEIQEKDSKYPNDPPWSDPYYRRLAYNKVADFLKSKGYRYIFFGNQVDEGRWEKYMQDNADMYFNFYKSVKNQWESEFQRILWNTTMLEPFYYRMMGSHYQTSYRRCITNTLEKLKEMPSVESPKFVFAHIYSPHVPYVFGANGEYIEPINWENLRDKKYQLGYYIYISKEIKKVVDEILNKSNNPPIIILQSDHGFREHTTRGIGSEEWRKILNAQYLPGGGKELLYDSISPVNTFRLIFNYYFGTDYPLLEDD